MTCLGCCSCWYEPECVWRIGARQWKSRSSTEPHPLCVDQRRSMENLGRHWLHFFILVNVNNKDCQRQLQVASCSERASCYCSCDSLSISRWLQRRPVYCVAPRPSSICLSLAVQLRQHVESACSTVLCTIDPRAIRMSSIRKLWNRSSWITCLSRTTSLQNLEHRRIQNSRIVRTRSC